MNDQSFYCGILHELKKQANYLPEEPRKKHNWLPAVAAGAGLGGLGYLAYKKWPALSGIFNKVPKHTDGGSANYSDAGNVTKPVVDTPADNPVEETPTAPSGWWDKTKNFAGYVGNHKAETTGDIVNPLIGDIHNAPNDPTRATGALYTLGLAGSGVGSGGKWLANKIPGVANRGSALLGKIPGPAINAAKFVGPKINPVMGAMGGATDFLEAYKHPEERWNNLASGTASSTLGATLPSTLGAMGAAGKAAVGTLPAASSPLPTTGWSAEAFKNLFRNRALGLARGATAGRVGLQAALTAPSLAVTTGPLIAQQTGKLLQEDINRLSNLTDTHSDNIGNVASYIEMANKGLHSQNPHTVEAVKKMLHTQLSPEQSGSFNDVTNPGAFTRLGYNQGTISRNDPNTGTLSANLDRLRRLSQ